MANNPKGLTVGWTNEKVKKALSFMSSVSLRGCWGHKPPRIQFRCRKWKVDQVVLGLLLLIVCEVLTVVHGSMCVVIREAGVRARSTALHHGAWCLGPACPRSPLWSLAKPILVFSIIKLLRTMVTLLSVESASKPFRHLLNSICSFRKPSLSGSSRSLRRVSTQPWEWVMTFTFCILGTSLTSRWFWPSSNGV